MAEAPRVELPPGPLEHAGIDVGNGDAAWVRYPLIAMQFYYSPFRRPRALYLFASKLR
jgi:hypothetical protein